MQDKALDSHVYGHAKGNKMKKKKKSLITFTQNDIHCVTIRTLLAIFMILYDRDNIYSFILCSSDSNLRS